MLPSNLPTVITYLVGNYENTLHPLSSNRNIPKCYSSILLQHHQTTPQNSYAGKTESRTLQNRAEKPRKSIIFLLAASVTRMR